MIRQFEWILFFKLFAFLLAASNFVFLEWRGRETKLFLNWAYPAIAICMLSGTRQRFVDLAMHVLLINETIFDDSAFSLLKNLIFLKIGAICKGLTERYAF
jgi:hypothetical protein